MGESTKAADAVDKLVRAVNGKFNVLKFDDWKRTAQSVIRMRHSGISDILEGRPCPEPKLISPRPPFMRSRPSRAVTRSQAADETDTQSGENPETETAEKLQPDAGSTPVDTAHLLPSSTGYSTHPAAPSVFSGHGQHHLEFGRHQKLAPRQPSSVLLPLPGHIGSCGQLPSKFQAETR